MVKLVSKENLEYYTLRVKNKFSEIRDDLDKLKKKATTYEEVTYAELVTKRQNRQLTAGGMYRIVDYETTVANDEEARSAGHVFDLIVRAISSDTLSEEAYAIQSERDTDGYFSDANLNAWQVWYCLDNDTTRFQWADEENGKGVIYRLIDEWRNDCPYDFKNVQFKRCYTYGDFVDEVVDGYDWENTHYILSPSMDGLADMYVNVEEEDFEWFYTFTYYKGFTDVIDASLIHEIEDDSIGYGYEACHSNEMKAYYITKTIDDTIYQSQALNNIVITSTDGDAGSAVKLYSNKWGTSCCNMTFHEHCYENIFGLRCSNIIGFKSSFNTFGNYCSNNTFGNDCSNNTFGNYCNNNTFGNNCYDNTFGEGCEYNTFRYGYDLNTFGNNCYDNTFGEGCDYNTFGNNCYDNTFGEGCEYNTFGNNCHGNTFVNNCYDNTFGNYCSKNTFGTYIFHITAGEDVIFLDVTGGTSNNQRVQNAYILNGTKGKNGSNRLTVTIPEAAQVYHYVGLNSKGELKIWTPADLVE